MTYSLDDGSKPCVNSRASDVSPRAVPEALAGKLTAAAGDFAPSFDEVRMEDIAAASGVPRATLYYYFAGKDDEWLHLGATACHAPGTGGGPCSNGMAPEAVNYPRLKIDNSGHTTESIDVLSKMYQAMRNTDGVVGTGSLGQENLDYGLRMAMLPDEYEVGRYNIPADTDFFERTHVTAGRAGDRMKKDDPAYVARLGFDAMLRGEADVVAGWRNKAQVAASKLLPAQTVAQVHRKIAEPGSDKQEHAGTTHEHPSMEDQR